MIAVLIILGANYPQGGKQDEQQMAKSGTMAPRDRSFPISIKTNSKSNGVPNPRSVSRISDKYSNDSNQRSSNSGNTVRPTTERAGGQQQPTKPVTPKTPQTKPEPEKPKADPVLLSLDTKVATVPLKQKQPHIKNKIGRDHHHELPRGSSKPRLHKTIRRFNHGLDIWKGPNR
jgi:hypothetical protein